MITRLLNLIIVALFGPPVTCKSHGHTWNKWAGGAHWQFRECKRCGWKQIRHVEEAKEET